MLAIVCVTTLASCSAGFTGGNNDTGEDENGVALGPAPGTVASTIPAGASYGGGDSGSKTLQRLDATAFDNTVHDLTGTEQTFGAQTFPTESRYANFDNVGSSLSMSASFLSAANQAATALGDEVVQSSKTSGRAIYLKVAPCAANTSVDASSCLKQTVQSFGLRAWRRPLTAAEVKTVSTIATSAGSDLPSQVGAAVATLLNSPYFLFRVEIDPNPKSTAVHALSAYELATRLSYFLWRTCPDDTLLASASSGALVTDAGLKTQLLRMLGDPRANTLVTEFAWRWLGLDVFDTVTPDATLFPHFNDGIRQSMRRETQTFLADFIVGGAPLNRMLTANYSYLDSPLAGYYGVIPASGGAVARTTLPASSGRVGVLSQGSMLVAGSTGADASPVKRGRRILTQLLCQPLGNPPDNVAGGGAPEDGATMTARQGLEAHRADPDCSFCHVEMDPLGFAFDGFSGSGEKRTLDHNLPIDTTGVFDEKRKFSSNADLSPLLAQDPRFAACASEMLFIYAIGRPSTDADGDTLAGLTSSFAANNQSVVTLIQQLVLSQAFRSRHAVTPDPQ